VYQGYEAFTNENLAKFILILIGYAIVLDIYLYRGLSVLFNFIKNKKLKKPGIVFHWSFFVFFIIVVGIYFGRGGALLENPEKSRYIYFLNTIFFLLYVPKTVFAVSLAMRDVLTFIKFVYSKIIGKKVLSTYLIRKYFLKIGFSLSVIIFGVILYGIFVQKNDPVVIEQTFFIKDLPKDLDSLHIVQISDLHVGSFKNTKLFDKSFEMINDLKPDVLVVTGDIVNFNWKEVLPFRETFMHLDSSILKLAVLGNHDFGDYIHSWDSSQRVGSTDSLTSFLEQTGFKVLRNENLGLGKTGNKLYFAGVDNWSGDHYKKYGKLDSATKFIPKNAPVVMLSHDPSHWSYKVIHDSSNIVLTLSGHTHGGQSGIRYKNIMWSPISCKFANWGGHKTYMGHQIYINTGLGVIGLLGRLGMRPEITSIILKKDL
jgi:predicted MPP superfamily phosphohydrolase